MLLARRQHRLLADDSLALHLASQAGGLYDEPMPAQELHGGVALIFDGNPISEHVAVLYGHGLVGQVHRVNGDPDAGGGEGLHGEHRLDHLMKRKNFPFSCFQPVSDDALCFQQGGFQLVIRQCNIEMVLKGQLMPGFFHSFPQTLFVLRFALSQSFK